MRVSSLVFSLLGLLQAEGEIINDHCGAGGLCETDESSMLQVQVTSHMKNDAGRVELLALQKKVTHLSGVQAEQATIMGNFLIDNTKGQIEAVKSLPMMLQSTKLVEGYVKALQHSMSIGQATKLSTRSIEGDSTTPAAGVLSYLKQIESVLEDTGSVAADFSGDEQTSKWCPGMHIVAIKSGSLAGSQGKEVTQKAIQVVSDLDHPAHTMLLQNVNMKQLAHEELSSEQMAALTKQFQAAATALEDEEVYYQTLGQSVRKWCMEDIAENCPPMNYPILSTPLRKLVENCVDAGGNMEALGDLTYE